MKIVPIVVGTSDFDVLCGLGEALADVIGDFQETDIQEEERGGGSKHNILIVASSDMNHYESAAITRAKDHKAIDRMLALDARGLWEVVMAEDISMCGFGPAVVMLVAANLLGRDLGHAGEVRDFGRCLGRLPVGGWLRRNYCGVDRFRNYNEFGIAAVRLATAELAFGLDGRGRASPHDAHLPLQPR